MGTHPLLLGALGHPAAPWGTLPHARGTRSYWPWKDRLRTSRPWKFSKARLGDL